MDDGQFVIRIEVDARQIIDRFGPDRAVIIAKLDEQFAYAREDAMKMVDARLNGTLEGVLNG